MPAGVVVVAGTSAGRLAGQPLADLPGIGARAGGQFRPCRGSARRQRAWYRPRPVADSDVAGRDRRAQVARELADELREVPGSGAAIVITNSSCW